jgi:hypothetical protein
MKRREGAVQVPRRLAESCSAVPPEFTAEIDQARVARENMRPTRRRGGKDAPAAFGSGPAAAGAQKCSRSAGGSGCPGSGRSSARCGRSRCPWRTRGARRSRRPRRSGRAGRSRGSRGSRRSRRPRRGRGVQRSRRARRAHCGRRRCRDGRGVHDHRIRWCPDGWLGLAAKHFNQCPDQQGKYDQTDDPGPDARSLPFHVDVRHDPPPLLVPHDCRKKRRALTAPGSRIALQGRYLHLFGFPRFCLEG